MATINGTGSTPTLNIIIPVLGLDFIATDVAADSIFKNLHVPLYVNSNLP